MVAMTLDGQEDFLIIGCDGLWDTIGVDESAFIVLQYLHHESKWHLSLLYIFNIFSSITTPGNRLISPFSYVHLKHLADVTTSHFRSRVQTKRGWAG